MISDMSSAEMGGFSSVLRNENQKSLKEAKAGDESGVAPQRKIADFDQFCSEMSPSGMAAPPLRPC